MPEYLYPGVYVEETNTGNKPIEGVSTSTVGFLGIAARGPDKPTFLTSYSEFTRIYGSYVQDAQGNPKAYLAYGVEGFFQNGGLRCWVSRVAPSDATSSQAKLPDITISAIGPGAWGAQIGYLISNAGLPSPTLFRLTLMSWPTAAAAAAAIKKKLSEAAKTASIVEVFDNLSADPLSSTYYVGTINGVSNLVTVTQATANRPPNNALLGLPAPDDKELALVLLGAGSDGTVLKLADFQGRDVTPTNDSAYSTGLKGLAAIDNISLLCCPDETAITPKGTLAQALQTQCETLKDRFAILQATSQEGQPSGVTPSVNSKYAAYYYPWLKIVDPTSGNITLIPPGGHVAGIYARSDTQVGVHKDPANEVIRNINSLQVAIDNQTQAVLNPIGVNALRFFRGQGNLVWGGRTTSSDPDWKYINVRRLFIFVETSIERGTQWVVFEPNDKPTWARVRRSVGAFLNGLWHDGMLQGAKREDAYFVRCDRTTMTQADIDNGRLIVLIGIAPVKPAEFVIFRIGQWTGGSSITEG